MKVALVTGICVPHDAISSAVVTQAEILSAQPSITEVIVVSQFNGCVLPCASYEISDPWQLVALFEDLGVEAAVFHFGIRYELFNALWLLDGSTTSCAVHFHNVTPPPLAEEADRATLEQSVLQAQLMAALNFPVWTFSDHNRAVLTEWGIAEERLQFVPLVIEAPRALRPRRHADVIRLLTVGRLVHAKGVHVLIDALALLLDRGIVDFELRVAGNAAFSSTDYHDRITAQISQHGLGSRVHLVGQPSDDELWALYEETDVVVSPSLHEGLCIPVIEGYVAGCRAIGTDAGNLPYVVCPPDKVARANDPESLADVIETTLEEVRAARAGGALPTNAIARQMCEQFSRASASRHLMHQLGKLRSTGASTTAPQATTAPRRDRAR
ncbi:MAG TPA: glycosyltransferase [Acidimicrobiales bacterium]|nr:glycosyltransferase [Acidimicrobiales bacterium]